MPATPDTPPIRSHSHLTHTLAPSQVQPLLQTYLLHAKTSPHLHPDSFLSQSGITFSIDSGPKGGIALHHLQRIAAGLGGEHLEIETREELEAQFGSLGQKVAVDDERLDSLVADTESTKLLRKATKKRKRDNDDISRWAEDTSQQLEDRERDYGGTTPREIESFANTPMHVPMGLQEHYDDWQERHAWEYQQAVLEGEVGERERAPVVRQGGSLPEVVEHDDRGEVVDGVDGRQGKTQAEKEERKRVKRARKEEERRRRADAGGKG